MTMTTGPLVGRDVPQQVLREWLAARSGSVGGQQSAPPAQFVSGEAGIGKRALIRTVMGAIPQVLRAAATPWPRRPTVCCSTKSCRGWWVRRRPRRCPLKPSARRFSRPAHRRLPRGRPRLRRRVRVLPDTRSGSGRAATPGLRHGRHVPPRPLGRCAERVRRRAVRSARHRARPGRRPRRPWPGRGHARTHSAGRAWHFWNRALSLRGSSWSPWSSCPPGDWPWPTPPTDAPSTRWTAIGTPWTAAARPKSDTSACRSCSLRPHALPRPAPPPTSAG